MTDLFHLHTLSLGSANSPGLILLGFMAGTLSGYLGIGGGIVVVPFLNYLGAPMPFAVGTSMAYIAGTTLFASLRHSQKSNVAFKTGLITAVFMIPAIELGAQIMKHFSAIAPALVETSVRTGLLLLNVYIVTAFFMRAKRTPLTTDFQAGVKSFSWAIPGFGILAGLLSGCLGVGGGVILVPLYFGVLRFDVRLSIGTSSFVILLATAYATISYSMKGSVDHVAALLLIVGAAFGATLGASAVMRVPDRQIKISFASIAGAVGVSLVLKEFGQGRLSLVLLSVVTSAVLLMMLKSYVRARMQPPQAR